MWSFLMGNAHQENVFCLLTSSIKNKLKQLRFGWVQTVSFLFGVFLTRIARQDKIIWKAQNDVNLALYLTKTL